MAALPPEYPQECQPLSHEFVIVGHVYHSITDFKPRVLARCKHCGKKKEYEEIKSKVRGR